MRFLSQDAAHARGVRGSVDPSVSLLSLSTMICPIYSGEYFGMKVKLRSIIACWRFLYVDIYTAHQVLLRQPCSTSSLDFSKSKRMFNSLFLILSVRKLSLFAKLSVSYLNSGPTRTDSPPLTTCLGNGTASIATSGSCSKRNAIRNSFS